MTEKQPFANPDIKIHHELAEWAAKCAERTLYLFEQKHPDDNRPRLAIEAIREWIRGDRSMMSCREAAFAAHSAAREANEPEARAAARATGQAVAVAHMYTHCSVPGEYATMAAALAVSDELADETARREREWQWSQLREDLRPIGFPHGKEVKLKIKR
jgi:hypothetical protein